MIVGLVPQSANALAGAGYCGLLDLANATREQLLAIRGVGPKAVVVLEEILNRPLPRRGKPRKAAPTPRRVWPEDVWRKRGLPPSAAVAFAVEGITLERLSTISREELLAIRGVGKGAIEVCELMIGHKLPSTLQPGPCPSVPGPCSSVPVQPRRSS